jgi:hypothetical protein
MRCEEYSRNDVLLSFRRAALLLEFRLHLIEEVISPVIGIVAVIGSLSRGINQRKMIEESENGTHQESEAHQLLEGRFKVYRTSTDSLSKGHYVAEVAVGFHGLDDL